MSDIAAFITGLEGAELSSGERDFLSDARPAGIIFFERNCRSRGQLLRLVEAARAAIARDELLLLVDQEGGRVQRMRPPEWPELPSGAALARIYERDPKTGLEIAGLVARLAAEQLTSSGLNTNCVPVLDVPQPGAHEIIGDRALGRAPAAITALGRAICDGHLAGGVLPVVKHIPGHGRAGVDSHLALPRVTAPGNELDAVDFAPFRELADYPAAMTAHVVYEAFDGAHPASTSQKVIDSVIRGVIGFDGLLMSDDLSMKALSGEIAARTIAVRAAGCDLALHCNGRRTEMEAVATHAGLLDGRSLSRFRNACRAICEPADFARDDAARALETALAEIGPGSARYFGTP